MGVHEAVAIGIGVAAAAQDLRSGRIPNALTFGSAIAACLFAGWSGGVAGIGASLSGWVLALLLWLPLYALGGLGAGDVKLVAAIGAWLGPSDVVPVSLYSAIAGGGMAAAVALARGQAVAVCANLHSLLLHWRVSGLTPHPDLTLATARGARLAYAVPILTGTVVAIWLR